MPHEGYCKIPELSLIEAWHGTESMYAIGQRLGVTAKTLKNRWARLRAESKLPPGRRPPHIRAIGDAEPEDMHDGRPHIGKDPLLAALQAAHGDRA